MKRIALDTSFLLFAIERKIDIEEGIERLVGEPHVFVVPTSVIRELERLARSGRRVAPYASVALKLIEKWRPEIVETDKYADDWLMEQDIMATTDLRLARAARKKGVRIISITKSNKLVMR